MRKCFLIICCMVFLISCEQAKEPIDFRITWKAYSGRGETVMRVVNNFNKTQDDYFIQVHSGDENLEDISKSLSTDTFDVYVLPYRYIQKFNDDELMPINRNTQDIYPSLVRLGTYDNQLYGLPWLSHSMALIYNKTYLDQLNINMNNVQSMSDFLEVLETIDRQGDVNGIGLVGANHHDLSWMVNQFVYTYNGQLIQNDELLIPTDSFRKALKTYRDDLGQYAQEDWLNAHGGDVMKAFLDQQVIFEIQGPWGITDVWKNGSPFTVDALPLSQIGLYSEVGPMMLAIDKDMENERLEVVNQFMTYMVSQEVQETLTLGEYSPEMNEYYPFRLPVIASLEASDIFSSYDIFDVFIEGYNHASIDVPTPQWMVIKEELYTMYLHEYMMNNMTFEEFIETMRHKGKEYLED